MITLEKLLSTIPCKVLCDGSDKAPEISGGYCCDMLSWVVSRIETGDIWLTILNSINVVAVASLAECACVLLTEDVTMEEAVLQRAAEKNLVILSTSLTSFAAAGAISRLLAETTERS